VTLDEWVAVAAGELGVDAMTAGEQRRVLDVAREVAHNTLRPGAPLAAYLIGLAVGRGMTLDDAARAVIDAAERHRDQPGQSGSQAE
jgi:hypothetical protein